MRNELGNPSAARASQSGQRKARSQMLRDQKWSSRTGRRSVLSLNRSNVRRKPAARRTSPFKQMMRKQTIGPAVAAAMRDQPDKGDRRRSVAQRKVNRKA